MTDIELMREALDEAKLAAAAGEMPVGCVIVRNGEIVARAHNECEARQDATAHAELLAIRRASAACGDWRLNSCTLYVPTGSKSAYQNADVWKDFTNIVEYEGASPSVLATGPCGDNLTYTIYDDMSMVISGTGPMWDYVAEDTHPNQDYYGDVKVAEGSFMTPTIDQMESLKNIFTSMLDKPFGHVTTFKEINKDVQLQIH